MDSQLTIYLEAPQEKNRAKNQRRVMRATSERIAEQGSPSSPSRETLTGSKRDIRACGIRTEC
jgi:hypothetical protein